MRDPLVLTVRPDRGVWRGLSGGRLIYWQKDAEWSSASVKHKKWIHSSYLRLLSAADLVVTVSRRLCELAKDNGVDAEVVPNGCDLSLSRQEMPEPASLAHVPRPRAVYAGSFSSRVDHRLFERLVQEFPGVSFVVVGVVGTAVPPAPNVHAVGSVAFEDLGAYLQHSDVGLVPYVTSEFNAASCPLKIYDYLAAGLPVITTGVDTDGLDGRVVQANGTHDQAVSSFRHLVVHARDLRHAAVREARRNTWDARVETLIALVQSRL
jgi:glycosyltransferase involved in cell wall biosynthesis